MVSPTIGMRIQQAREELGITQQELAAKLGCTQAALSNYELGKRRLYLANLERIDTLKRQVDYFISHLDALTRDQTKLF